MAVTKVATCCYCGTKAALVLRGKTRHELSCSRCGAPLRALKMLPIAPGRVTAPAATPTRLDHRPAPKKLRSAKPEKGRKRKNSKGLFRKVLKEVWDEFEDLFD